MQYLVLSFLYSLCLTQLKANEADLSKEKIEFYSEYIGYEMAETLQMISKYYDPEAVIRGFRNFNAGIRPKSKPEEDPIELLVEIQNEIYEKKATENLIQAEAFLQKISKQKEVIELVEKKLYYEILREGSGTKEITSNSTPIFCHKMYTIDNIVILDEKTPSPVSLDDSILGFEKGVIGMKQGEQRKLYIHPDLGYRKSSRFPPNTLFIFEVEAIEVDS